MTTHDLTGTRAVTKFMQELERKELQQWARTEPQWTFSPRTLIAASLVALGIIAWLWVRYPGVITR